MRVMHPVARLKLPQVGTSHLILNITSNKRQQRKEVTSWNCGMSSHAPHSAGRHISTKSLILTIFSCHIPLSKKLQNKHILHGKLYNPNFYITKCFKLLQEKIYITKSTNKLTKSTGQFRDSMLASDGMLPASLNHNWGL